MTDVDAIGRRVDEAVGALVAELAAAHREIERLEVEVAKEVADRGATGEVEAAMIAVAEVSAARQARAGSLSRAVIEQIRAMRSASLAERTR